MFFPSSSSDGKKCTLRVCAIKWKGAEGVIHLVHMARNSMFCVIDLCLLLMACRQFEGKSAMTKSDKGKEMHFFLGYHTV